VGESRNVSEPVDPSPHRALVVVKETGQGATVPISGRGEVELVDGFPQGTLVLG
jgi:hypothetical protein